MVAHMIGTFMMGFGAGMVSCAFLMEKKAKQ